MLLLNTLDAKDFVKPASTHELLVFDCKAASYDVLFGSIHSISIAEPSGLHYKHITVDGNERLGGAFENLGAITAGLKELVVNVRIVSIKGFQISVLPVIITIPEHSLVEFRNVPEFLLLPLPAFLVVILPVLGCLVDGAVLLRLAIFID